MPSKDISYQVALKPSFCSAATLSEVLGMWPRPFRKLLGREHLSPYYHLHLVRTNPRKSWISFCPPKMQGFGVDKRKYHGWWVSLFAWSSVMARAIYTVLSTGCWSNTLQMQFAAGTCCCTKTLRSDWGFILITLQIAVLWWNSWRLKKTGLK